MSNKSNELKKNEELCEGKEELSLKELEQVCGGVAHLGTNTDVDRSTIKKEIVASIQQIDDDALLTFN